MVITAGILLVIFGWFTIDYFIRFFRDGVESYEMVVLIISAIISALSAGIIWGGLFQ